VNNVRNQQRRGFSLLEILLALAILGGSLAVLSQIAEIGTSAAREARDLSICRILCQAKLSEVLLDTSLGISPQSIFNSSLESFDSASITSYAYSIEVQPSQLDGLLSLRVTVQALESDDSTPIATFSLTRWVVDPTLGLEQAEADEKALKEELSGVGEA
jgi:prepilin-type N-terminal cleavage/methylation domain-containing protein